MLVHCRLRNLNQANCYAQSKKNKITGHLFTRFYVRTTETMSVYIPRQRANVLDFLSIIYVVKLDSYTPHIDTRTTYGIF